MAYRCLDEPHFAYFVLHLRTVSSKNNSPLRLQALQAVLYKFQWSFVIFTLNRHPSSNVDALELSGPDHAHFCITLEKNTRMNMNVKH
jgi:hypothetical protein